MDVSNHSVSYSDLISFVRQQSRELKKQIDRHTEIEKDLGVTGEEAAGFINAFSKRFSVDISKFSFDEYFNDEPNAFSSGRAVQPLTIAHLEKAILAGRLDEEVIKQ